MTRDEVTKAAERYRQWIAGEIHECHETEWQFREDAFTLADEYHKIVLRGGCVVSREDCVIAIEAMRVLLSDKREAFSPSRIGNCAARFKAALAKVE